MSVPGGGFNINIGANLQGLRSALGQIPGLGAAAAQRLAQAFSSINPQVNLGGVVNQVNQVNQAAQQLQSRGQIRIRLIGDGADATLQQFSSVSRAASALAGTRYSVRISADVASIPQQLAQARVSIQQALPNQTVNIRFVGDATQVRAALKAIEADAKAAEARGVKLNVTLDTEAARRETARLAAEAQQRIKLQISVDGAEVSAKQLRDLQTLGQRISSQPVRFNLQVDAGSARSIERLRQQIQSMGRDDIATIHLRGDPTNVISAIRAVRQDITQLEARGGRLQITADTTQATERIHQLQALIGGVGRGLVAGTGIGGNLLIGAGALTAATAGVVGIAVVVQALSRAIKETILSGIQLNAQFEQSQVVFRNLTGSIAVAEQALQRLQKYADITPFNTEEVVSGGQAFLQATGGNIKAMEQLVDLAGQLAATDPTKTFGDAVRSINELLAGQTESIAERFNIPRSAINNLREAGVSGLTLVEALVKLRGGSRGLVQDLGQTFTGQLTTAQANLNALAREATKPIFELMREGLQKFNQEMVNSGPAWKAWARDSGAAVADIIKGLGELLSVANQVGNTLATVLSLPSRAGLALNAAARERGIPLGAPAPQAPSATLAAPPTPTAVETATQQRAQEAFEASQKATQEVAKQKNEVEKVNQLLTANAAAAAVITERYEEQLRPLREQIAVQETLLRQANARVREAEAGIEDAQGPIAERADIAGRRAEIEVARDLIQARHEQEELAERIGEAEAKAADRAQEAWIRTAKDTLDSERNRAQVAQENRQRELEGLREEMRARQESRQAELDGLRETMRARQQSRQEAIEGLREEIRARQEARQEELDGLREIIRARQEARQEAIEGLQEEIQARRSAYDEERQAIQDFRTLRQEAFQERQEAQRREHEDFQEGIRNRIERLEEANRVASEASRRRIEELSREREAFDAQERERNRATSLRQAERSVLRARTGRERSDALERLGDLREDQEAERRKEAFAAKEREEKRRADAEDRRRQEEINRLQARAREEDREFQRRTSAEQRQMQAIEAAERRADRIAEQQERETRKQEDRELREAEANDRRLQKEEEAQLRAEEKDNRAREKAEAAELRRAEAQARADEKEDERKLREAEKIAKEQQKEEERQLREAEKIAREQDRQAEANLRSQEAVIRREERNLEAEQRERREILENNQLARMRELAPLEGSLIGLRIEELKLIDGPRLAYWTTRLEVAKFEAGQLGKRVADLKDQETTVEENRRQALLYLETEKKALDAIVLVEKDRAIELERSAKAAEAIKNATAQALSTANALTAGTQNAGDEAGPTGYSGPPGGNRQVAAPGTNRAAVANIIMYPMEVAMFGVEQQRRALEWAAGLAQSLVDFFNADRTAPDALTDWASRPLVYIEKSVYEEESPSRRSERWASDLAAGFINEINAQATAIQTSLTAAFAADTVEGTLRAPFENFLYGWLPGVPQHYADAATNSIDGFITAYKGDNLAAILRAPFEYHVNEWLLGVPARYSQTAIDSVSAFTEGYVTGGLDLALRQPFEYFLNEWLLGVPQFFFDTAQASVAQWVTGYAEPDISIVLRAPFEYFLNEWMLGVPEHYSRIARESNAAWGLGYAEPEDLSITLRKPFEYFLNTWMPGVPAEMLAFGRGANRGFTAGYETPRDLSVVLREPFERHITWMAGFDDKMRDFGRTGAQAFASSFIGGLPTAIQSGMLSIANSLNSILMNLFRQFGTTSGIAFALAVRHHSLMTLSSPLPGTSTSTTSNVAGRQYGGSVSSGQPYLVHADELIVPQQAGMVLPSSVLRGIDWLAQQGASKPGGQPSTNARGFTLGNVSVPVTVNVTPSPGMDEVSLARKTAALIGPEVMGAIIEALDKADATTQDRVPRHLPGAL